MKHKTEMLLILIILVTGQAIEPIKYEKLLLVEADEHLGELKIR